MAEQRNIHTPGIIVKKRPLGESDFSVTLYSPSLGKIQATAKGSRKMTGSLAGHVETLNLCEFLLYKSPVRYTIVQCQIKNAFRKIREDFDRTMTAGLIMEIFDKSTHSNEHSGELFHLLEQSLTRLDTSEQHFLTVESFKLNLLQHIGVLPDLENCAACHRRWTTDDRIWLETNGHLNCNDCRAENSTPNRRQEHTQNTAPAAPIEFNIIKLIRYLRRPLDEQTKKITFNAGQKKQLEHITRFFLQHFLDREILSEKLLAAVRR